MTFTKFCMYCNVSKKAVVVVLHYFLCNNQLYLFLFRTIAPWFFATFESHVSSRQDPRHHSTTYHLLKRSGCK